MNTGFASVLRGFYDGLLDPLLVPTHVLALLALGLLIGAQPRYWLPRLAFVLGLAGGFAALALAVGETPAPIWLLGATAVAGLTVATAVRLPTSACAAIVLVGGAALGLDSPPQAVGIAAAYAGLAGSGVTAVLAVALIALGRAHLTHAHRQIEQIGSRILGSWVTASALLLLTLELLRGG